MNILRSALGYYDATGNPSDPDCLMGHSYGTSTGVDSPNRALAEYMLEHADARLILADRTLVDAFPRDKQKVALVVEGPVSNGRGGGVGTWGTLCESNAFMQREGIGSALMVGHRHHIGRIMMQAEKLAIDATAAPDLPGMFDPESRQRWTRSLGLWVPYEVLGSVLLRMEHKL